MQSTKQILKSLSVLYAEDNDLLRETTAKTLRILFGEVYLAKDGVEALIIYENHPVNILFLDYVMPNIDGYELAREIRKTNLSIPIIICSGYTDKEKLLKSIEIGIIKYIEKPLKYDELITSLEEAVESLQSNNLLYIPIEEGLMYDYIKKVMIKNGDTIALTKYERLLVELFIKNKGQLVTQKQIIDAIFINDCDINGIRNIIYRFRKKVSDSCIVSVKDFGYMMLES